MVDSANMLSLLPLTHSSGMYLMKIDDSRILRMESKVKFKKKRSLLHSLFN